MSRLHSREVAYIPAVHLLNPMLELMFIFQEGSFQQQAKLHQKQPSREGCSTSENWPCQRGAVFFLLADQLYNLNKNLGKHQDIKICMNPRDTFHIQHESAYKKESGHVLI